ncbi:MAG: hypothetical protein NTZ73_00275 [Candidatus Diapherotrites archaeon]|nr:hypothetical protein [Candidatus Diapherotrites archaeon]
MARKAKVEWNIEGLTIAQRRALGIEGLTHAQVRRLGIIGMTPIEAQNHILSELASFSRQWNLDLRPEEKIKKYLEYKEKEIMKMRAEGRSTERGSRYRRPRSKAQLIQLVKKTRSVQRGKLRPR